MVVKIIKCKGGLGIQLPKEVVELKSWQAGDEVEIDVTIHGVVVIDNRSKKNG